MERPPLLSPQGCWCDARASHSGRQTEFGLGIPSRKHLAMDLSGESQKLCIARDLVKTTSFQPPLNR